MYISKSLSEVLLNTQYSCFIAYAHTVEPCVWLAFFLCHLITQKKSFPLQLHSSGSKSRVNSQLDNWKPLPHQPESTKHVPKCRHNAQTQLALKHMDIFFMSLGSLQRLMVWIIFSLWHHFCHCFLREMTIDPHYRYYNQSSPSLPLEGFLYVQAEHFIHLDSQWWN